MPEFFTMVTCVKSLEAINADQDRARAQRAQEKVKDVGVMQGVLEVKFSSRLLGGTGRLTTRPSYSDTFVFLSELAMFLIIRC